MWWLLAAGLGAAAGGFSVWQREQREKEALRHQKEIAWEQYVLGKQHSDKRFTIQKTEALDQLGIQKRTLDTQLGLSVDEYNTALLGQAFGMQDARIQTNSAIGESLASEGLSGTRGNENNEMIRAYAAQGLERNIGVQDKQNSDYLNRMITGANTNAAAIERERSTWLPGGYRVKEKEAQDSYNLSLANLGQTDFDWRINQATPDIFLDYPLGILSGANSGASMGYSYQNFFQQTQNPWNDIGKGKNSYGVSGGTNLYGGDFLQGR